LSSSLSVSLSLLREQIRVVLASQLCPDGIGGSWRSPV
jgi:hypothetical protein